MATHKNLDICTWPDGPDSCEEDRKGCFPCRLRYWGDHGAPMQFSYGREAFHGETIKEQTEHMFSEAKRMGHRPPEYSGRAVLR